MLKRPVHPPRSETPTETMSNENAMPQRGPRQDSLSTPNRLDSMTVRLDTTQLLVPSGNRTIQKSRRLDNLSRASMLHCWRIDTPLARFGELTSAKETPVTLTNRPLNTASHRLFKRGAPLLKVHINPFLPEQQPIQHNPQALGWTEKEDPREAWHSKHQDRLNSKEHDQEDAIAAL